MYSPAFCKNKEVSAAPHSACGKQKLPSCQDFQTYSATSFINDETDCALSTCIEVWLVEM